MDITRRGFLRLLSAAAATAALPVPVFKLAEPTIALPDAPIALGAIRVMSMYDIGWDHYAVRLDAFNGVDQFHCDFKVDIHENPEDIRAEYLRVREAADSVLRDHLIHHGWRASDLIALPTPAGYIEPAWMRAA